MYVVITTRDSTNLSSVDGEAQRTATLHCHFSSSCSRFLFRDRYGETVPFVHVNLWYTGIAGIFALAKEYHTTSGVINNLTSKCVLTIDGEGYAKTSSSWSIFLLGWGGIFAVMLMKRYGRLPVLFWSQVRNA
jgi:hypothetical protein